MTSEIPVCIHTEEDRKKHEDNQLNTCCGKPSDKRLLIFISSLSISLLVLTFCCFQLVNKPDCQSQNTYVGLITLIIGIWLKSPLS